MANLLYPASTGHYTDDKYSALLEPNLWYNNIFIPGVTYTDKYQLGPAGQIFVHKPGVGTVTPTVDTLGGTFTFTPSGLNINPSTGEIDTNLSGETKHTLAWIMDACKTPMGSRLLRRWLRMQRGLYRL